jgi:hypothetical protein
VLDALPKRGALKDHPLGNEIDEIFHGQTPDTEAQFGSTSTNPSPASRLGASRTN